MKIEVNFTRKNFQALLCAALEGGSNYWYRIDAHSFPDDIKLRDFREGGRLTDPDEYWHPEEIIPVTPGCSSLVRDIYGDHKMGVWLNWARMEAAFNEMLTMYPQHAADALEENEDSTTGDVFLQMAVYGEVVYG